MFDPYHKWLGIPKEHRPPTYYQLLGLAPTEKDQEVIEEAAIRQTTHLRAYQIGPHAAECTRLLNEISQARLTLLNSAKRKEYDAKLAKQETKAARDKQAAREAADPFADLDAPAAGLVASKHPGGKSGILAVGKRRPQGNDMLRGLLVGAALGLVVVVLIWLLLGRSSQPSRPLAETPSLPTKKEEPVAEKEPKKTEDPPRKKEAEPKKKDPEPSLKQPLQPSAEAVAVIQLQAAPSPMNPAGLTVDNRLVVHGQPSGCVLWDWQKGQLVRPLPLGPSWASSLAFLPDGKHLLAACADLQLRLCDFQTGQVIRLLGQPRSPITDMAISADGRFALTGGGTMRADKGKTPEGIDLDIKLWELATGKLVRAYPGCAMPIRQVALSQEGRFVFAFSWDRKTRRWERESGGEPKRLALALEPHNDVVFSRHGTQALIRSQNSQTLMFWDLAKDEPIREFRPKLPGLMGRTLELSPDNRLLVVADIKEHNIFFIDAVTGQLVQKGQGHTNNISTLAFSPDGRYVLSQARDQTLRVWAVPSWP